MAKIKILSEEVANRIAAGEVIERPASVVKELVENAIDSGANKIIVSIEKGGKKYINVTDNGCGMSRDDAILAFESHATSKISSVDDIFHISSFGFRGEALPSIASVSKLTLVTKQSDESLATKVIFEAGKLKNITHVAGLSGTSITVEKLFSNIPARKKFLKSDQIEFKHILNYLHYQSVVHPEIHLKLISNNRERLNYPVVKSIEERFSSIFGTEFYKNDFLKINKSFDNVNVCGYISGLEEKGQFLSDVHYIFINGRFIKDKIIYHAIKTAYEPFIKKTFTYKSGKLPPYILFLKVDPESIDFNVHPQKLEIRFRDATLVHNFVKNLITDALTNYEENKFSLTVSKFKNVGNSSKITSYEARIFQEKVETPQTYETEIGKIYQPDIFSQSFAHNSESENKKIDFQQKKSTFEPTPLFTNRKPNIHEEELVNPWQFHQSYVIIEVEDGLMLIDQHAAHERIIYEKLVNRIESEEVESQKLLFPIVIDLPSYLAPMIFDLVTEKIDIFNKVGFYIKTFSGNSIIVDEIPPELSELESDDIFIEILKQLQIEFEQTENFRESLAKSISCKAAIKAGQKMSKKEMLYLINDLFACQVPYFCPHGRPLMFKITINEIEKRFKRIE
jgi:DNA mismatch repair protein MutL